HETVGRDVVRDPEGLPGRPVEEVARDRLARREGDGVDQSVETVPVAAELREERVDLLVVGDVAGKDRRRAELRGHLGDAVLETVVLVGEGGPRSLGRAGTGEAVGDRPVRQQAGDQDALAGEESHLWRLRTWCRSPGLSHEPGGGRTARGS